MSPLWALIPGWLLVLIIVVDNGLVILLITTRRNVRTTTNWFVLSLAVADFGVGAVFCPQHLFCSVRNETCANNAVKTAYIVGSFFMYASVTNLCALTLDRYLAIVHPLRYVAFMTKKRVALLVSAAWVVATLNPISRFLIFFVLLGKSRQGMKQARWVLLTILCLCVCIFLLFTTVRIFLVVRRIARQNAAVVAQLNFNHKLQHGVAFKARETASAKMIGIVVTVCLVCYILDMADSILLAAETPVAGNVDEIRVIIIALNSAVNPVAYAFHKRELRKEFGRLVRCTGQRNLIGWWPRGERKGTSLKLSQRFRNHVIPRG